MARDHGTTREINTLTATETVDLGVDARKSLTAGQLTKSPAGGGATKTWPGGPARRRPSGWLATSRPRRRLDDEPDRITDLFRHRRAGATGAAWSRRHRRGRGDAPKFRRRSATSGGLHCLPSGCSRQGESPGPHSGGSPTSLGRVSRIARPAPRRSRLGIHQGRRQRRSVYVHRRWAVSKAAAPTRSPSRTWWTREHGTLTARRATSYRFVPICYQGAT